MFSIKRGAFVAADRGPGGFTLLEMLTVVAVLAILMGILLPAIRAVRQKAEGIGRKLVGFETEGRAIARHGYRAMRDGVPVGTVTSGTFAPFLKKNIGLTYLPIALTEPGTRFEVEIRGRREPAVVVPTPFYKRTR